MVVYDEIDKVKKSNGQMESEDLVVEKNKMKILRWKNKLLKKSV